MDRQLLFRVLQVLVVAPWLYHVSNQKKVPPYFRGGLKLVAGTVVVLNVPPLMEAYARYKTAYENVIQGQATLVSEVKDEVT